MSEGILQSLSAITSPLLGDHEPAPYHLYNENGQTPCILVCDHASNRIPEQLDNLGMTDEDIEQHYAIDIGVEKVTEVLADRLNAPAILANYSRLVVDLNRAIDHPTAFVQTGEGKPVPGNIGMSDTDRMLRIKELYEPFHAQLDKMIEAYLARDIVPVVIAIHSFTPTFYKQKRPWDIGVLWVQDDRLPSYTIKYFEDKGYCVGDNEPYDARFLRGTTVDRHADTRGLPNALVEIRNDLISTDKDSERWADMLAECYNPILGDSNTYTLYDGPRVEHDARAEHNYFEKLVEQAKKGDGDE